MGLLMNFMDKDELDAKALSIEGFIDAHKVATGATTLSSRVVLRWLLDHYKDDLKRDTARVSRFFAALESVEAYAWKHFRRVGEWQPELYRGDSVVFADYLVEEGLTGEKSPALWTALDGIFEKEQWWLDETRGDSPRRHKEIYYLLRCAQDYYDDLRNSGVDVTAP